MRLSKTVLCVLISAALGPQVWCAPRAADRLDSDVASARALLAKKDYLSAENTLERLNDRYPDNPQLRGMWGLALSELGPDYAEKAVRLLEPAVNLYRDDAVYRIALCRTYINLGGRNLDKAVETCSEAVRRDPANIDAVITLAQAYAAKKDYKSALKYYRQADAARPGDYRTVYGLGMGELAYKKPKKALLLLRRAESLAAIPSKKATDREKALIAAGIGDAYTALGNRKNALEAYSSAEVLDPEGDIAGSAAERGAQVAKPVKKRDATLAELDRIDRAREAVRNPRETLSVPTPVKLTPEQKAAFRACMKEAQKYFAANSHTAAELKYRDCLEIQPGDAAARISLAGVLLLENNLDAANREFERGVRLLPPDSPMIGYCRSRQGDIELKQHNPEKAASYYRQAVAIDPTEVNARIGLGKYFEDKKEWGDAMDSYRLALSLEPGNVPANDGIRRVEQYVMTDPEVLAELKLRRALPRTAETVTPQDRELFMKMRTSERMRAIDYLQSKLKNIPESYTVSQGTKAPEFRLLLTLEGFTAYRRIVSGELLKKMQAGGVNSRNLFRTTDKFGNRIFDERGIITEPGMEVFYSSLLDEKAYYLPWEPLPQEVQATMTPDQLVELRYRRKGYEVLSETEVKWLEDYTSCSMNTMQSSLSLKTETGSFGSLYFLLPSGGKGRGLLMNLINRYRGGDVRLFKKEGPAASPIQKPASVEAEALCDGEGNLKKLKRDFDKPAAPPETVPNVPPPLQLEQTGG